MNLIGKTLTAIALSLGISSVAQAADPHLYAGIKVGKFLVDLEGADDPTPLGIQLGYNFGESLAVEFEYNTGSADSTVGFSEANMDITTMALYGAFRSEGDDKYFLAKLGLIREEVEFSNGSLSISEKDTGLSYGIGLGYRFNDTFSTELEYTVIEQDVGLVAGTARFMF